MTRKRLTTAALLAALVLIFGMSLAFGSQHSSTATPFGGTDSVATAAIQQSHPDYVPWFKPWFTPGSTEVESGLFALQAGLGGTVLGFAVGALWGRRHPAPARTGTTADAGPSGTGD